ncbi:MAG: hypothetical protein ABJE66_28620 [Deltaproteobacteria bacterium]
MIRFGAVVALALGLSCANHPALTVGIGAASVGLVSCEIQGGKQETCGLITGIVGLGLGGLAWLVTELADTNAHELPPDDEMLPDGAVRVHTRTELPPVPFDAGVIDAPGAALHDAAPADAAPGDAT